jgi:hypothetical protein
VAGWLPVGGVAVLRGGVGRWDGGGRRKKVSSDEYAGRAGTN